MKIWKTIDKYFSENEIKEIYKDKNFKPFTSKWYDINNLSAFQKKLLKGLEENVGENFANISKAVGVEQWTHDASLRVLPELHFDKDETKYEKTGELVFPLCSIILYLKVDNLRGGNLYLDGKTTIVPETGKVVYLASGILHGVTEYFEGTRLSVNLNVWDYDVRTSK
tara:strand:- start:292 stop:795 length:504 start_codon:yes stop_codon:yes gene_type:complete